MAAVQWKMDQISHPFLHTLYKIIIQPSFGSIYLIEQEFAVCLNEIHLQMVSGNFKLYKDNTLPISRIILLKVVKQLGICVLQQNSIPLKEKGWVHSKAGGSRFEIT